MNKQTKLEEARRIRVFIEANADLLTDDAALDIPDVFAKWSEEGIYQVGNRVRYNEKLYKCLQDHAAQADWTPTAAVSLWAEVLNEEIKEWVQPESTNPYMKGDKVLHYGNKWESDINNNVWEPGIYGWSMI